MNKSVSLLVLFFVFTTLGMVPASPNALFNPADDTYTDLNSPTVQKDGNGLLVDYSSLPGFTITRRSYLRFDISTIAFDATTASYLRLRITRAATLTTNGVLALYGTDDDWNGPSAGNGDETTLTWSIASGPGELLDTKPVGAIGTDITFSSPALITYINNQRAAHGGNNLISFLIQWNSCSPCSQFLDNLILEDRENSRGSGAAPILFLESPTAVSMAGFEAHSHSTEPLVTLEWSTASEINIIGFNIYRATNPIGERQKLNNTLIWANNPGEMLGDDYSYNDSSVAPGEIYYYWVEAVQPGGGTEELGPEPVIVNNRIYLPLTIFGR